MTRMFGFTTGALLLCALSLVNGLTIEKRALAIPKTLPGTWLSQGCYTDVGRTLSSGGYNDNANMTIENCINYCSTHGYIYAGTEYSAECYCGMNIASAATTAPSTDCGMPCTGNSTEPCGGGNRLNMFWSNTTGPQTNPGPGNWTFSGCYTEGTTGRALQNGVEVPGGGNAMTVGLCTDACKAAGYNLAGVEYSGECYCDNAVANGGALAPDGLSQCNMLCNGNFSEFCGGPGHLNLYDYNKQVTLPPWTTVSGASSSSSTSQSSSSSTSSPPVSTTSSSSSSTSISSTVSSTSSSTTSSSSVSSSSSSIPSSTSSSTTSSGSSSSSSSSSSSTPLVFNHLLVSSSSNTHTSKSTTSTSKSVSPSSSSKPLSSTPVSTSKPPGSSSLISSSKTSSSTSKISTSSTSKSSTASSNQSKTSSSTSSASPAQTSGIRQTVGKYAFQGCYTEATQGRALSAASFYDYPNMTLEECATNCAAYTYFGVEYGGECYCGNSLAAGSVLAAAGDCSFTCPGNSFEFCGAGNRLEMYKIGTASTSSTSSSATSSQTGTSTKPTTSATTTGTTSKTSTTSASSSTSSLVTATGFPTGWTNQGCWVDGVNGRILTGYQAPDSQSMTLQSCSNLCASKGYTIAGMEWAQQCFCDNAIYNGGVLAANQGDCNMACTGDSTEFCGAGGRLTIYSLGTPQTFSPPAAQKAGLPTGWTYNGCLEDNIASNEDPNTRLYTFPYMVWDRANNTVGDCINQCQTFGFNAAGVEYGSQCFCGDVQNIAVASAPAADSNPAKPQFYTRSRTPQLFPDSQCTIPCTGNKTTICGDGNRLSYYSFNGTTPLYKWGNPTGTAAGQYSMLIGGVIVPLMTAQMVTGKVTFIEKSGSGEPNATGAFELDLSQTSNFNNAWRMMSGLQTDVFCSAGLILPDKAGRQLTIGGWAEESNFGVRLYYPDGSDGVPGKNEWVEAPGKLSLQVARWYPSALTMANGSVLIVGGEIGSNADEQPTLEILPPTGVPDASTYSGYSNTTVYLDFLQRTAPFNLYPFITVVPSGIFIAYYNEARILDEKTFQTIKTLPNMPAGVNDPTGGRTYQLEGTMVSLPQTYPFTDHLKVLVCGGSTSGAGYAIDNCVSTAPEDANPVWTIERMPSRRAMPCMAGLPDGTYGIFNGAQHGVAGFGLANDPNYNAVIYDPSKPVNQRMSIMANTTIARLYHSEAIVLLDGRVLITGSDPTGDYNNPPDSFPEEYRVEVFSPPYLFAGTRPTFSNLNNKDWSYTGAASTATFTVTGSTAGLKVSLLGAVVSTHGNSMGQRTLFPLVSCSGQTCTVTAPPNAHVAPPGWFMMFVVNSAGIPSVGQYVRIGGDPAGLGNWPKLPGFTLPGV